MFLIYATRKIYEKIRRSFGSAQQLGQTSKTRQKWDSKSSWNWRVILVPATIWQVLNMKTTQRPEMKAMSMLTLVRKKTCEITLRELILGGFLAIWNTVRQCAAYLEQNARTQNTGAASVSLLCWEERNAERGTCKAHGSTLVKKLLKPVCQLWFDAKL